MGQSKTPKIDFERISDLLERLGDIPPQRVRLRPVPGTATEKDVIRAEARCNRLCELIDGTLVEKPVGYYESRVATVLGYFVEAYLVKNDVGIALGADGMLRVAPEQVRMPDLSFFFWSHFPDRRLPPGQILDAVPDLAVEILSPSNTKKEMERKRKEYFLGGASLIWEIDPLKKTARVYTAPDESKLIREGEALEGGDVLPGFTLSLADLFRRAGERSEEK